jgi:hypothetical protein
VLAGFLLAGFSPLPTATAVLVLCCSFLLTESIVLWTKRDSECGCYGAAHPQQVDGASVVTSFTILVLAVLHLMAVAQGEPIAWGWRLGLGGLFGGALCWLAWRTFLRWRRRSQSGPARFEPSMPGT